MPAVQPVPWLDGKVSAVEWWGPVLSVQQTQGRQGLTALDRITSQYCFLVVHLFAHCTHFLLAL